MVEQSCGSAHLPLLPLVSDEHSPSFPPTVVDCPSPISACSRSRSPKERLPAYPVEEATPLSTITLTLDQETEDFLNPGYELNDCSGPSYSDRVWLHNDNFEDQAIYRAAQRMGWQQSSNPSHLFCTSELNFNRRRCNTVRKHHIREMVNSLPSTCQAEARLRLEAIELINDIKLMVKESPSIYIEGLIASNCKFYIGISERPKERFELHRSHYKEMALWIHPSRIETVKLEKYLINKFRSSHLMANIADGGQAASAARPHFLYVVSG
jgi:hypothetical protein